MAGRQVWRVDLSKAGEVSNVTRSQRSKNSYLSEMVRRLGSCERTKKQLFGIYFIDIQDADQILDRGRQVMRWKWLPAPINMM